MKVIDLGLKHNWRAFKEFVQTHKQEFSTNYYFVIHEDDCGDEVNIFTDHEKLDGWLSRLFWDWGRYDTNNLEDSMDNLKVWMLIPESKVQRLSNLYKGSRKTSIVKNGERLYRKLIPVSVEQTIIVSTNWY